MKKFFLTALGLVGLMLGSCQQDDHLGGVTQSGSNTLKLVLGMESMGSGETRATVDAVTGEEEVNNLYLFFFEPSSDRSGTYQGHLKLDGPLTMNTAIELSDIADNQELDPDAAYKILAVANVKSFLGNDSEIEWLADLERGTTKESVVFNEMLAYIRSGEQIEIDNLFMTGQADKPADPVATIPLTLTRGLVRFDVVNSVRDVYNLRSVSVWNAFPQTSMFGGGLMRYETMERIHEFYRVDNSFNDALGIYPDMLGGLYAFPNQVISPGTKDQKTTCLIVGLGEDDGAGGESVSYHRINIAAQDAMQNLKRNNVYRLTIRSVSGPGAGSEIEAYAGGINNINYKINYWELDDDGLLQQNGNIVLGIPTKLIRFGAEADERDYKIFAFGGTANEQIRVSTSGLSAGLDVNQVGNTITVKAEALTAAESERTGTIVVNYGGLEATIGILQSGNANKFLRITTPSGGGLPLFPYNSNASAFVDVEASGAWTAKIYQFGSPNYFSVFDGINWVTDISSTELTKTVTLKTTNENNTGESRPAFVLFALKDDPDNYNSALVLTQLAKGNIWLTPNIDKVEWTSSGDLVTLGGMSTKEFKFKVETTKDESLASPIFYEWEAKLGEGASSGFEITESHNPTNPEHNYITVKAKGTSQGASIKDKLVVSLTSDSSTSVDVDLEQEGYVVEINPSSFATISNKGGTTAAITVSSSNIVGSTAAFTWSAEITSMTASNGSEDVSATHMAVIANPSTNGTLNQNQKYALSQKFAVKFPKLLYGNHKKGTITATVKLTLWRESGGVNTVANTHTFKIVQNELKPAKLTIYNYHGSDTQYRSYAYGNLYSPSSHYMQAWRSFITTLFTRDGQDIAYPNAQSVPLTRVYTTTEGVVLPTDQIKDNADISNTVNYIHASQANGISKANGIYNDQQGKIEKWRQADNGVMVVSNGNNGLTADIHNGNFFWSLRSVGWRGTGLVNSSSTAVRNTTNSKITKFIYVDGPFGPVGNDGSLSFPATNSSQSVDVTGTDGVAIIGSDTKASLAIDPVGRIVFIGENEFFSTANGLVSNVDTNLSTSRSILLANVAAYAILTAQYGSNFSDLFVD